LPGYSGSPVYIYFDPGVQAALQKEYSPTRRDFLTTVFLGIDCYHLPQAEPVRAIDGGEPIGERWYVDTHTGMAAVVPATKILELLMDDTFVRQRSNDELLAVEEAKTWNVPNLR
jgi:hypothetical protein